KFPLLIEPVLLPRVRFFTWNIDRARAFGDDPLQPQSFHLFYQYRQFRSKQRVQSQGIRKIRADFFQQLLAFTEWQIESVTPVEVKEIEDVINDWLPACLSILQLLETGAAALVQCDNFPIQNKITLLQILERKGDLAKFCA